MNKRAHYYKTCLGAFCLFPLLAINPANIGAFPVITGVSGTFTNKSPVVITGAGFSQKQNAGPLISSYDNVTAANNWSSGTLGGGWTFSGAGGLVNTGPQRCPWQQSSYTIRYNTNSGLASIRHLENTPHRYNYISMWMYRDYSNWNLAVSSGSNNKFMRLYFSSDNSGPTLFSAVYPDNNGVEDAVHLSAETINSPGWSIAYSACNANEYSTTTADMVTTNSSCLSQLATWEHWEWYLVMPSTDIGNDGSMTFLKDGMTLGSAAGVGMLRSGDNNDARSYLLGMLSGGRTVSGYDYIDQVYIDNTPAHVSISSSPGILWPDVSAEDHSEIQVPSAWSDGSITFTLNQGSFSNGETAFLYVVDTTGNSNPIGFPFQFGSSGVVPNTVSRGLQNAFLINNKSVTTGFSVSFDKAVPFSLIVFDLAGKRIWEYACRNPETGMHQVLWTHPQASDGPYFAVLDDGRRRITERFLLVK